MAQTWFATTSPGLETALVQEIRSLGGRKAKKQSGGVEFTATNRALYSILRRIRCASRVYMRIDNFRARDFPEIYNKTRRISWPRFLTKSQRLDLKAYSNNSSQTHTGRISKTVAHAIDESFVEDFSRLPPLIPDIENRPDALDLPLTHFKTQRLVIKLEDNRCTLNLDASGDLLYRRGWKRKLHHAPLRDSTASAILRLAEWTPEQALIDPMCGSGTIPLEAWCMAHHVPPAMFRRYGIESWANFQSEVWKEVSEEEMSEYTQENISTLNIKCSDRDENAVRITSDNAALLAKKLKVERLEDFQIEKASVTQLRPTSDTGLIVTNAPYGIRLTTDVNQSLKELFSTYIQYFSGWKLVVLLHRDYSPPIAKDRQNILADFRNGGIPVRLWEFV